mgnify:CR=1 FL=1
MPREVRYPAIAEHLTALRQQAGWPSTRVVASSIGYSHASVADTWHGHSLPNGRFAKALIAALKGDWTTFEPIYTKARAHAHTYERGPNATQALADAINNLADAIRTHTREAHHD